MGLNFNPLAKTRVFCRSPLVRTLGRLKQAGAQSSGAQDKGSIPEDKQYWMSSSLHCKCHECCYLLHFWAIDLIKSSILALFPHVGPFKKNPYSYCPSSRYLLLWSHTLDNSNSKIQSCFKELPQNVNYILISPLLYRWRKWSPERLNELSKDA